MRRQQILAVLLLLSLATAASAQAIDVAPSVDARVGRDAFVIVKLAVKDAVWDIIGDKAGYELAQEKISDPAILLFRITPKAEGTYTLVVSGATGDKVVQKKCAIVATVGDPVQPNPDNAVVKRLEALEATVKDMVRLLNLFDARLKALEKKEPPPGPKSPAKHFTFIGPESTAVATAACNDPALRLWLKSKSIAVHVLTANDPDIKSTGLIVAVNAAGGVPCVVVQDDKGVILTQAKITQSDEKTAAAAITELVTPFAGK